MTTLNEHLARLDYLKADRKRLGDELRGINDRLEKDGASPSLKERAGNLVKGLARLDQEILEANAATSAAAVDGLKDGTVGGEYGDGANPDVGPAPSFGFGGRKAAPWGDAVVKANSGSHGFKALLASGSVAVSVPLAPDPIRPGVRLQHLRQLIPTEKDNVGRFSYLRQTTRTNNAAVVAEGGVKPTSVYTLTRVDDRARVIAHLSEQIPRQTLDDAGLLGRFIQDEMFYGLNVALDTQIISGDGTGENMLGILAATSGVQTQAWSTNILTTLRKAITNLEEDNLTPDAFLLSPADWETIELVTETGGGYVVGAPANMAGPPIDAAARRLWGIPVLVSTAVTTGVGVLGDFAGSSRLWIREEARIDWSENVASDYTTNHVRFRAEMRAGFGLLRPTGFVSIDLTAA